MDDATAVVRACDLAAIVDGMSDFIDTHLHLRIDVPGRLQPDRLQRALLALTHGLPELAGRFERRWWRSRWHIDPDPHWHIEEVEVSSAEAAELRERTLYAEPFEPHDTLPVRAVLLHMPEHDRLLLRVSHLLADGGGSKNLCYRIARAYRAVGDDPSWNEPPVPSPHFVVRLLRAFRWRRLPAMLLALAKEAWDNRPMRPIHVPMGGPGPSTAHYRALHLQPARVERMRARWKARGVTLNDLALAAFTRAVVLAFPEASAARSHAAVVATADLRQYEPAALDVCNHSSLRPLVLRRLPLPAPEQTVAAVRRVTRGWKASMTSLLQCIPAGMVAAVTPHAFGRWAVSLLLHRGRRISGACTGLTNIGPIRAEDLDFGDGPCIAARVTSPVAHPYMLIAAVTGCAGALDFTVGYRSPQVEHDAIRRLVQVLDRELAALE